VCRHLEKEFHLKEVLSARRFLPEELRHLPRLDTRKEKLKTDIRNTLQQVNPYQQFEDKMKLLGYAVLKGRGISFIDDKKVKIKGSEVGFSLAKIEKILHLKQQLKMKQGKQKLREEAIERVINKHAHTPVQKLLLKTAHSDRQDDFEVFELEKELQSLLNDLLKPEYGSQSINPELLKEAKRKRILQKPS
jgi:DNA-binding transcriptional MerR regulator